VNGKESRSAEFFTVVSTVGQIFGAKRRNSAQRGENSEMAEIPGVCNSGQRRGNLRKKPLLNYKSAALSG
jgi:hypothetical protein